MIDIIVRDCGRGEWLPLIRVTQSGWELYRGDRQTSHEAAWNKAIGAWESNATQNIVDFKAEQVP